MTSRRLPLAPAAARPAERDGGAGPWYADGIRFECQRTGRCCTNHGEYAYVYLSGDDERRLAGHLGLARDAFRRAHTVLVDGHRALRSRDDACVFLDRSGCSVHAAKPSQCARWPFWRENLDAGTWQREIAPFCEGVGKGRLWTREEIEAVAGDGDDDRE